MNLSDARILSITAHPDDEVLGFGATAALAAASGATVTNCFLSGTVEARRHRPSDDELRSDMEGAQKLIGCQPPIVGAFPNIRFNTVAHIELVQFIESVIAEVRPQLVFTHWMDDLNEDHYHTSKACLAAVRIHQRNLETPVQGVYLMEILSSTDWSFAQSNGAFTPNTFCAVGEVQLQAKLDALHRYRDVMRDYPHPRSDEAVRALATMRGAQSGLGHAEAFQCVYSRFGTS